MLGGAYPTAVVAAALAHFSDDANAAVDFLLSGDYFIGGGSSGGGDMGGGDDGSGRARADSTTHDLTDAAVGEGVREELVFRDLCAVAGGDSGGSVVGSGGDGGGSGGGASSPTTPQGVSSRHPPPPNFAISGGGSAIVTTTAHAAHAAAVGAPELRLEPILRGGVDVGATVYITAYAGDVECSATAPLAAARTPATLLHLAPDGLHALVSRLNPRLGRRTLQRVRVVSLKTSPLIFGVNVPATGGTRASALAAVSARALHAVAVMRTRRFVIAALAALPSRSHELIRGGGCAALVALMRLVAAPSLAVSGAAGDADDDVERDPASASIVPVNILNFRGGAEAIARFSTARSVTNGVAAPWQTRQNGGAPSFLLLDTMRSVVTHLLMHEIAEKEAGDSGSGGGEGSAPQSPSRSLTNKSGGALAGEQGPPLSDSPASKLPTPRSPLLQPFATPAPRSMGGSGPLDLLPPLMLPVALPPPAMESTGGRDSFVSAPSSGGGGVKPARLSTLLLTQCVESFVSTTVVVDRALAVRVDSLHPPLAPADWVGELALPVAGSGGLRLDFDARCALDDGASLVFSINGTAVVGATFAGRGPWAPLVISPGTSARDSAVAASLMYRYTAPPRARGAPAHSAAWGFAFSATQLPGQSWANEAVAVSGAPSLDWATWMLHFLLRDAGACARELFIGTHHRAIVRALVTYLRTPAAAAKGRAVSLLSALLAAPDAFAPGHLDRQQLLALTPIAHSAVTAVLEALSLTDAAAATAPDAGVTPLRAPIAAPHAARLVELAFAIAKAQRFVLVTKGAEAAGDPCWTFAESAVGAGGEVLDAVVDAEAGAAWSGAARLSFGAGLPRVPPVLVNARLTPPARPLFGGENGTNFGNVTPSTFLGARPPDVLRLLLDFADGAVALTSAPRAEDVRRAISMSSIGAGVYEGDTGDCVISDAVPSLLPSPRALMAATRGTRVELPGARVSDALVTRAWLESSGASAIVETPHPLPHAVFRARVRFPGAANLRIAIDRRSALPEGAALNIYTRASVGDEGDDNLFVRIPRMGERAVPARAPPSISAAASASGGGASSAGGDATLSPTSPDGPSPAAITTVATAADASASAAAGGTSLSASADAPQQSNGLPLLAPLPPSPAPPSPAPPALAPGDMRAWLRHGCDVVDVAADDVLIELVIPNVKNSISIFGEGSGDKRLSILEKVGIGSGDIVGSATVPFLTGSPFCVPAGAHDDTSAVLEEFWGLRLCVAVTHWAGSTISTSGDGSAATPSARSPAAHGRSDGAAVHALLADAAAVDDGTLCSADRQSARARLPAGALSLDEAALALSLWPKELDAALLSWLSARCARGVGLDEDAGAANSSSAAAATRGSIANLLDVLPSDALLSRTERTFPLRAPLARLPPQLIALRIAFLRGFNAHAAVVAEIIDSSVGDASVRAAAAVVDSDPAAQPLSAMLLRVRDAVFGESKARLLSAAVNASATRAQPGSRIARPTIVVDNLRAMVSHGAGVVDALSPSNNATFLQVSRELVRLGPRALAATMRLRVDERGRVWSVKYLNEDGIDYGGVFRDALTRCFEDVFSPRLDLLVAAAPPGAVATTAGSAARAATTTPDRYIPHPRFAAPALAARSTALFEMLGRLLGVSLRAKLNAPCAFPPFVWKSLCGQEIGLDDLRDVDSLTVGLLERVASWAPGAHDPVFLSSPSARPPLHRHAATTTPGAATVASPGLLLSASPLLPARSPQTFASPSPVIMGRSPAWVGGTSGGLAFLSPFSLDDDVSAISAKASGIAVLVGEADSSSARDGDTLAATTPPPPMDADEAAFAAAFPELTFKITALDGEVVELCPGGASRRVLLSERFAFVSAAIGALVALFDAPLSAIRRGLYMTVPSRVLRLLSWQELEVAVSGRAEIDLSALRAHTEYDGYRRDDVSVQFFWRALETFSMEERSLFIRFVWGRSRLPLGKGRWPRNFKISRTASVLPLSHTCFFHLELPPFQTLEKAIEALQVCIHYGNAGVLAV